MMPQHHPNAHTMCNQAQQQQPHLASSLGHLLFLQVHTCLCTCLCIYYNILLSLPKQYQNHFRSNARYKGLSAKGHENSLTILTPSHASCSSSGRQGIAGLAGCTRQGVFHGVWASRLEHCAASATEGSRCSSMDTRFVGPFSGMAAAGAGSSSSGCKSAVPALPAAAGSASAVAASQWSD